MSTKFRVFNVLLVLFVLLTAFAGSAQAKGDDFCTKHPEHWKCQDNGGSEEVSSDVVETDSTETQIASDGDQIVEGPGNTVIVCQAHDHGKYNEHPVSANNAAKYVQKHEGSYMGHCKKAGGGDEQDDGGDIIIIVDDDEQDDGEERERRQQNEKESFGLYTGGVYTTTLAAGPALGCYNESYISGDENVVVQICGDNNEVIVNYGDSQQAAEMLDVTNANVNMARNDLELLQGQVQLLNEQIPATQAAPDLTWLKTPLWVLVIGLIALGLLAIAAFMLHSWLYRPLPVQPANPSDIEVAHVALPPNYPHSGK